MKVLVTGATGFIGQALSLSCIKRGFQIQRAIRVNQEQFSNKKIKKSGKTGDFVCVGSIGSHTDWSNALQDIDAVVHLAARVHVMQDKSENPLEAFREVNTAGTDRLAGEAAKAGVKRFVYLSSIKVNGENTGPSGGKCNIFFSGNDIPSPRDPYAVSKWEAEQILHTIAKETGMEVVIVRPPLVYGPAVKANFLRLLKIVDRGVPLPLGSIKNARSLVCLDNLVDFLITCVNHPDAAGKTFVVSDGKDLSTPELIRKIAQFMGRPCRLFPFPPSLLRFVGKLAGKEAMIDRICGSLHVDISKARNVLGWDPPVSVDEGLRKTVEWYLKNAVDS